MQTFVIANTLHRAEFLCGFLNLKKSSAVSGLNPENFRGVGGDDTQILFFTKGMPAHRIAEWSDTLHLTQLSGAQVVRLEA